MVSVYFTSLAQSSQKPEAREDLNLGDNPIYPGSVISLCKTKDRLELQKCRKKYLPVLKSWYQYLTLLVAVAAFHFLGNGIINK